MATVIIDVNIKSEEAAAKAKDLAGSIKAIKEEQKGLKASGAESSAAYAQNAQQLRTLQAEQKSYIQLSQAEVGSNTQLRAQLALLTTQYNALSKEERDNTLVGKTLQTQIKATSDELKVNEGAVGDNRRNVGNYKDALKDVEGQLTGMIPGYAQFTQGLNSLNGVLKTNVTSLGLFKTALLSTGIGAIVVVLGSLITYLTSTQEGIDKITSVTRPLIAVFQSLLGATQTLGKSLFDAFSKPKELLSDLVDFLEGQVVNRVKAFGVIIQGVMDFDVKKISNGILQVSTGVEDVIGKVGNAAQRTGKFITDAANKGKEIDLLQKQIEKNQLSFNRNQIKYNDLVDEQLLKSKDVSLSYAEREKASREIIRLRRAEGNEEAAIIQKKIQKLKIEQSLNDTSRSGKQEMIDLEVELDAAQDKGLDAEKEQLRVIGASRQEQNTKRLGFIKQQRDAQAEADKAREESIRNLVNLSADAITQEVNNINTEINEKIAKYKGFGMTVEALEKERVARLAKVNKEYADKDLQLQIDQAKKLTDEVNKRIDLEIGAMKEGSDKKLAISKVTAQRELAEADLRIAATSKLIEDGDTKQTAILQEQIKQRELIRLKGIQDEATITAEAQKTKVEQELKNQVALAQLKFDNAQTPEQELAARQEFLTTKYALDLEMAQGNAEQLKEMDIAMKAEQDAIDEAVFQNKVTRLNQFSKAFQDVTGKNTLAAKIAAEVSAKIDAAQQIRNSVLIIQEQIKAIVSQGKLIFPLNIAAIFSTLGALAAGIGAAKSLASMPKAFAEGGVFTSDGAGNMVRGKGTSTSDSINARLSNGESVINARSTSLFAPLLSAINQAGGGRALSPGFAMASGGLASGSYVTSISDNAANSADMTNAIIQGFMLAPPPIVDVREVTSAQQKNARVDVNKTI